MDKYLDRIVKAPPTVKFGGLAALVILMTAANYFLVIQPLEDESVALRAQQRKLDLDLAEKSEIAQNLNERRREMDVLEQKLAEALTELPQNKDVEELLAQLNDIGKKSGLEISRVEPGAESVVSGNYHEIAMFLQEVSNMRRIVNVNNIKLEGARVKNEKVVLSSSFMATTFRFVK